MVKKKNQGFQDYKSKDFNGIRGANKGDLQSVISFGRKRDLKAELKNLRRLSKEQKARSEITP